MRHCCLLLLTLTQTVHAQSVQPLDDEIAQELSLEGLYALPFIDIATGYAVPLEKAPSVATIITAEDIQAMGAQTLDEVLDAVPGVHAQPSTLTAGSVYSIRGMNTSQTPQVLILLNGQRISSDLGSSIFPSSGVINVKNIARVEVVRGPGSAVYGADAFSGVINIVTKSARDLNGGQVGIRGGSFDTRNVWAQYGKRYDHKWEFALNFEYMDQGADTSRMVYSDSQSGLDALFGTSASLTPGHIDRRYRSTTYNAYIKNSHWKVSLDGWAQRDVGQGAGVAQALDEEGYADIDQVLFAVQYNTKDWYPDLDFTSTLSYQYLDLKYLLNIFPPGNVSLIGSDGNLFTSPFNPVLFTDGVIGSPGRESKIAQADFTFLYSGIKNHTWRFNFGAKYSKLEANSSANFGPSVIDGTEGVVDGSLTDTTGTPYLYIENKNQKIKYFSIQDVWNITPDWSLTTGVRYDHYSDFGSTINPRIALVWTATDSLTTKFLYGQAFRAPSLAEFYGQNNPVVQGNPNLDPETIDTYEIAFSYEVMHDFNTGLSLYYYQAEDMIDFIDNGDGSKTAQNFNSVTGQGIELEGNWKINDEWTVIANYAYQKTINEENDNQLPYVPKQQFYLDARWSFKPDWVAAAQLNWIADRERAEDDARNDIDDYTLVNFSLRRKNIAKHWEIAASIKNLFDEDIREPSDGSIPDDYPMNERSAFIELSYYYDNK